MDNIIEVAEFKPAQQFKSGWYIPHSRQRKRSHPDTTWRSITLGWTTPHKGFEVIEMKFDKDTNYDTWLRVAGTKLWVAFIYGPDVLGDLEARYGQ